MTTQRAMFRSFDLRCDDIEWSTPIGQVRFIETLDNFTKVIINDITIGYFRSSIDAMRYVNKQIRLVMI